METWPDTMAYLSMSPQSLPYTNRYEYIVCAAVMRPGLVLVNDDNITADNPKSSTTRPALLLIQRATTQKTGALNWELPGGRIENSNPTLEAALRNRVPWETGLTVKNILRSANHKPLVRQDRYQVRSRVLLTFLVTVEEAEVTLVEDKHCDWRWVECAKDAEDLQMSKAGRKALGRALEVARKVANARTG